MKIEGDGMIEVIDISLFAFLVIVAVAIARLRNLFMVVMLSGIFSLLSAGLFVVMDAVDVAFTEAAVGAGISTVLLLLTLDLTTEEATKPIQPAILPLMISICVGGALLYATTDMPAFGDPNAPVHRRAYGDPTSPYIDTVATRYLETSLEEIDVPNMVTSVLGSYRGYDTLGETTVVFTAAVAVMLLLRGRRRFSEPSTIEAIDDDENHEVEE